VTDPGRRRGHPPGHGPLSTRAPLIGLIGPIGCGKSTVAGFLAERGAAVIDADQLTRELMSPGTLVTGSIVARFGQSYRHQDGSLDRAALGRLVFSNPDRLAELESVVHPAVENLERDAIRAADAGRPTAIALEAIKLVEAGHLDEPDDVIYFRYNELRVFMGNPAGMDGRVIVAERKAAREKAYTFRPREWVGTVTATQLAFPYLNLWGFPEKFLRKESAVAGQVNGIGASPGVVEGVARVVVHEDQFDDVRAGDILICQMTNPAWVVLFTKIVGLVTDAGGTASHPAVLSREFGIPAVVGTSVATAQIKDGDRVRVNGNTGLVEILANVPKAAPVGFKD